MDRVLRRYRERFLSPIREFDDRGPRVDEYRATAYHLADLILKTKRQAFTVSDLVRAAVEAGVILRDEGLNELAQSVVDVLLEEDYLKLAQTHSSALAQLVGSPADGALSTVEQKRYRLAQWVALRLQDMQEAFAEEAARLGESEPLPVQVIGDYEVLSEIGRGGLSVVYLSRDRRSYHTVAVKLAQDFGGGIDVNAALRQEARALTRAQGAGVVKMYEFREQEPYSFMALEYCNGGTLEGFLEMHKSGVSLETSVTIVGEIAHILKRVHDCGVYRIDLKPSNVAFDSNGQIHLIDFGTAVIENDDVSEEWRKLPIGTPDYIAPEMYQNPAKADKRVDMYALGVVFYQMLTGNLPPETGLPDVDHLPSRIAEVVWRLLGQRPQDRYENPKAVIHALPEEYIASSSGVYNALKSDFYREQEVIRKSTAVLVDEIVQIKRSTEKLLQPSPAAHSEDTRTALSLSLEGRSGPVAGHSYRLGTERLQIGRLPSCDVVIIDARVSRVHAAVERVERGFRIIDLNSSNGVLVNGERIQRAALLMPGYTIQIGPAAFVLKAEVSRVQDKPEHARKPVRTATQRLRDDYED